MLQPGDRIDNKYQISRKIASAGFGTVYEGWHLLLGRKVAIKAILPGLAEEERFTKMFEDEAANTAKLSHENIVQVYDFITDMEKGQFFMVMQLIDGKDIRQIIKQIKKIDPNKRVPYELIAYIISRVCSALAYAHEREDPQTSKKLDLVHRDVSPSNIMISYDGTVKLMDFGIAKAEGRKSEHTRTGVLKGKIAYMSPEQAMGQKLDGRSDIYSLGIVMYEMLTFQKAFQGSTDLDVLQKVAKGHLDKSPLEENEIPPSLKSIVLKALNADLPDRYQSAQEMYLDLHNYFSSIDAPSMQKKLSKYMCDLFAEELADREHAPDLPPPSTVTDVPLKTQDVSEVATGTTNQAPVEITPTIKTTTSKPSSRPIVIALAVILIAVIGFFVSPMIFPTSYGVIDSIPQGADVKIDGNFVGVTPIVLNSKHSVTKDKQHTLELSHVDYPDIMAPLVVNNKNDLLINNRQGVETKDGQKNYFLMRFLASLELTSIPSGATIFLQNENMGKTPQTITYDVHQEPLEVRMEYGRLDPLPPLQVNLINEAATTSSAWGFNKYREEQNTIFQIMGHFSRKVTITAKSGGSADLYIDNEAAGRVPATLNLTFGEHQFRIERDNLSSGDETYIVSMADSVFELVLKKKVRFLAKRLNTNQELEANVTVYDAKKKVVSSGKTPSLLPVPAGDTRVEYKLAGYETETVYVNAAQDTLIEVEMDIVRPVVSVTVTDRQGNPISRALVISSSGVSGRTNNSGKVSLKVAPNRTHEFTVRKEGYRTMQGLAVKVGSAGVEPLPVRLNPEK